MILWLKTSFLHRFPAILDKERGALEILKYLNLSFEIVKFKIWSPPGFRILVLDHS